MGDVRGRRARLHQPQLLLLLRDHVSKKQHPLHKENKQSTGIFTLAGQQGFGRLPTHKTAAGCHPVMPLSPTHSLQLHTQISSASTKRSRHLKEIHWEGVRTQISSLSVTEVKTFRGNLLGKVMVKKTFIQLAFQKKLHVTKCSRHTSLPSQATDSQPPPSAPIPLTFL